MRKLTLFMAHPIAPDNPDVEQPIPVTIVIDELVPEIDYKAGLGKMHIFYDVQANVLVDALYHALPQGTFDRVALKMFEKKLSLYRGVTNS